MSRPISRDAEKKPERLYFLFCTTVSKRRGKCRKIARCYHNKKLSTSLLINEFRCGLIWAGGVTKKMTRAQFAKKYKGYKLLN